MSVVLPIPVLTSLLVRTLFLDLDVELVLLDTLVVMAFKDWIIGELHIRENTYRF